MSRDLTSRERINSFCQKMRILMFAKTDNEDQRALSKNYNLQHRPFLTNKVNNFGSGYKSQAMARSNTGRNGQERPDLLPTAL